MSIGEKIAAARKAKGWSQENLSEMFVLPKELYEAVEKMVSRIG